MLLSHRRRHGRSATTRRPTSRLAVESLESRLAPATGPFDTPQFAANNALLVAGEVSTGEDKPKIFPTEIIRLEDAPRKMTKHVHLRLQTQVLDRARLESLRELLQAHRGSIPVLLRLTQPSGVLLYLAQEGRGIGLVNKLRAYGLQDKGFDTVDANLEIGAPVDARDYEQAAEILHDLGFTRIRLMTNNPDKIEALEQAGIEVMERVPLVVEASAHNKRYLDTKKKRLSHKL